MNINWYPGHMKKTKESIKKNLTLVDIIYELLDGRIPLSSKNPDIDSIIGNTPKITIFNKSDLSSEEGNRKWKNYFKKSGFPIVFMDLMNNRGLNELIKLSYEITEEKRKNLQKKGIKNKPIRVMVLGIPNVGKSTLINTISGRKGTKTGNRPGVTKGNQWIKIKDNMELLDTPGILWPKFEDENTSLNLAFTGAIKDEVLDVQTLALKLIESLKRLYPQLLKERYEVDIENVSSIDILNSIAYKRGCILRGEEIDYEKVCNMVLDDFRKGRIGRVTLEMPEDLEG